MSQNHRHARWRLPLIPGRPGYVLLLVALAAFIVSSAGAVSRSDATVDASVETQAVPNEGDAADDPAIWIDPANPSRSLIIGTDKLGGLAVYDLSGVQLAYYDDSTPNNVDVRYGFPLGGERVDLVVTSDTTSDSLRVYRVNPDTRALSEVSARTLETDIGVAGLCLYQSPHTNEYYAFVSDSSGTVQQWELRDDGAGGVDARKVRTISVGSTTEACVADDRNGHVYISEEEVGIWRYGAEPDDGTERVSIDEVGPHLSADIEGLAIYDGGDRYLIASSQSSDDFAVYSLAGDYLGRFEVDDGDVDGTSYTDGIEVTNADLGGAFASGLFVAQDDRNDDENQNFKLVAWERIAHSFTPPLAVDPSGTTGAGLETPVSIATPVAHGATTYFVDSRAGNDDNTGTSITEPWETLGEVNAAQLEPGDRLLFRSGSSWTGTLDIQWSGTSDNPILVSSYDSGDLPTFTSGCFDVSGSHIIIQGIRTEDCSFAGISLAGDNNRVERCQLTSSVAGVYIKAGATGNQIIYNQIVDNDRMSVLDLEKENDSGAFGVLINGDETEVAFNTISGSDAFSHDYGRDGAAVEIFGGQHNFIHHNVSIDNDAFVELGDPRAADNTLAYNLVRSSLPTSSGVVTRGGNESRGPVLRTRLDNNTIVLTGTESQGFVCFAGCGPEILTMRNNIVASDWKVGYADAAFDEDYNLFFGGLLQFTPGPHSMVTDPRLSGGYTPTADSSAIDRGVSLDYNRDLIGRPVPTDGDGDGEAAPDLGAYEYLPTTPADASSTVIGNGWIETDVGGGLDRLDATKLIVPAPEGGSGLTSPNVPRDREEREEWLRHPILPGPRAAIEIHRAVRTGADGLLLCFVRMPEDVKGGGNSGSAERAMDLGRGLHQVARRGRRHAPAAPGPDLPQPRLRHPGRQSVRRRLRQPIDPGQDVEGYPCSRGVVGEHGGSISFPAGTNPGERPCAEITNDLSGETDDIRYHAQHALRTGTHDVAQEAEKGIRRVNPGAELARDPLNERIHGRTGRKGSNTRAIRFRPYQRRERIEVVVLLAMFRVEHARYVVDPWRNIHAVVGLRQASRPRNQTAQVAMYHRTHELDVVIARHEIDGMSGAQPATESVEDRRVPVSNAVEPGDRYLVNPFWRRDGFARQTHPRKVKDISEKQETMSITRACRMLPQVVQPVGERNVVGKRLHEVTAPGDRISTGGKVKIAHDDDRLFVRRHAASTSLTGRLVFGIRPQGLNVLDASSLWMRHHG